MFEPYATGPLYKDYRFDNGLGASVIAETRHDGRFNLAVLGPDLDITTETEGPNGEYQHLTAAEVDEILGQIAALNPIVSWRVLGCGHGMTALSSIPTHELKCLALCDLA